MNGPNIVVKLERRGLIKRVRGWPETFTLFRRLIKDSFPESDTTSWRISYQDSKGDPIAVQSDSDLHEAYLQLGETNQTAMKFKLTAYAETEEYLEAEDGLMCTCSCGKVQPVSQIVKGKEEEKEEKEEKEEEIKERPLSQTDSAIHACACNSCGKSPIIGVRYSCSVCPSYNLCSDCEAKGVHSEHILMKVRTPEQLPPNPSGFPFAGIANLLRLYPPVARMVPPQLLEGLTRSVMQPSLPGRPGPWNMFARPPWGAWTCLREHVPRRKKLVQPVGGKEKRKLVLTAAPGAALDAVEWKLQNCSKKPWPKRLWAARREGDILFDPVLLENRLQPGTTMDLRLPLKAPRSPGKHFLAVWFNDKAGNRVGCTLRIQLTVEKTEETELDRKATELAAQGYGPFDVCYEALSKAQGDVEAAKAKLSCVGDPLMYSCY